MNVFLVSLEFVSFSGHWGWIVLHRLLARHEIEKSHVGSDGHSTVESLLATLFGTHQPHVVRELFKGLGPFGRLGLMSSLLVLHGDDFLRVAILDVANGEVGTLLDNSFQRPLFLFYPTEFVLRKVVGQCVIPKIVDLSFKRPGRLDLVIVELGDGFAHVLDGGQWV